MRNTEAKQYLQLIADWQASNKCTGVPPVTHNKKLSNWIQYCRTVSRRGSLNAEIVNSLRSLGIRLERGATDAHSTKAASYDRPRGMIPVLSVVTEHVQTSRRVPNLLSDSLPERHAASWLVRMQAACCRPTAWAGWLRSTISRSAAA